LRPKAVCPAHSGGEQFLWSAGSGKGKGSWKSTSQKEAALTIFVIIIGWPWLKFIKRFLMLETYTQKVKKIKIVSNNQVNII